MSNRYRNPFKIKATEKLESETNFLSMYSPIVLGELIEKNKQDKLWNNILFIRSSPGGGKTSILKIFEPSSLLTLQNSPSSPDFADTIQYLKNLEVLTKLGKVNLIGVYMSLVRNYEVIEDLSISEGQKKNIFFALINARVILSSLRSILNLNSKIELDKISLHASSFDYSYLDIQFPINGQQLFEWAAGIEKSVFKMIDSFLPLKDISVGHTELFSFNLMQPSNIIINGSQISNKIVFMFDDAHKLTKAQRDVLLKYLTTKRGNHNIWIAERLEALDEQRNFGSIRDRDYNEINLEEIWQGSNSKLKAIVASIAEKRASLSSENVKFFRQYLVDDLNESDYQDRFAKGFAQSISNIKMITGFNNKFERWLAHIVDLEQQVTIYQAALIARQTEILIYRSMGKPQLTFEFPFTVQELEDKLGGELLTTANYFLCIEQKIPYYFGFDNLVRLSSNNIEQFLSFSAELFEIMLSRRISDKLINIDAYDQEKLLKRIAEGKWKEQIRLVPYSDMVLKFLQNLAQFAQKETQKPNAPYAPGVNGFSLKITRENKLIDSPIWTEDPGFRPLLNVLKTCLAYNLLEKRMTKQGKENQLHTVYYLNRWICLRFNLPLNYGGFRHKNPAELLKWTK